MSIDIERLAKDREDFELEITKALRECHYSASDKDAARKIADAIIASGWPNSD